MSDRTKKNIILWAVTLGLAILVFCLGFFLKKEYNLVGWMNSCFYTGGIILCLGLLALMGHWGAFDFLTYGVRDIFFHMNPNADKQRKYRDYVDFVTQKKEARKKRHYDFLWPFLSIGLLLLIAAGALRIIYHEQTGL